MNKKLFNLSKKSFMFFCFGILLFFIFSFVNAQTPTGLSQEEMEDLSDLTVAANPQNWGEILSGLKEKILSNSIVAGINSFLIKINILFVILFGTDYSWSLFMLFVIVFWVFFLIEIAGALRMTSIFSKGISLVISLGLTIILAQLGLYSAISNLLFNNSFILNAEPWVGILFYVGIFILLIFIATVQKLVEKKLEKNKKILEEEKARLNRDVLDTYVSGIKKGWKE